MGAKTLTVEEVAERLRITPWTARRLCALGKIPSIRVGQMYRVAESVLDRIILGELRVELTTVEKGDAASAKKLA